MLAGYKGGAVLIFDGLSDSHLRIAFHHLQTSAGKNKAEGATIERKGSLLSIVNCAAMPGYAASLRDAVNYETQVTWNEPSRRPPIRRGAVVLTAYLLGTGIFMLGAVVLGLATGGLPRVHEAAFPGKVFDRPRAWKVLQLGLSGKTIDPRDSTELSIGPGRKREIFPQA